MTDPQVPSATRTLRVLSHLASRSTPASLENIARSCHLPRSTAYHLLNAMESEGFVVHDPVRHLFGLGVGAFEVGSAWLRTEPVAHLATATLVDLADRLGVSAMLAVRVGRDAVVVREERGAGMPSLSATAALRGPATSCPAGLSLLATLPRGSLGALYADTSSGESPADGPHDLVALEASLDGVRQRGYAACRDYPLVGLCGVAAAVPVGHRPSVAAILLVHRCEVGHPARWGAEASRAAASLAEMLPHRQPWD